MGKTEDSNEIPPDERGIAETQDVVDVCARNKIAPEIVKIRMSGIDGAWERVIAKQARYRFVIDAGA